MPDVKIHKMSGAGNDFVVMDGRGKEMDEFREAERIRELCREFRTDGLMILDIALTDLTDFRMEFYNPDGSGGMMCGNGGRCIVAFADWLGIAPSARLDTALGGRVHPRTRAGGGAHRRWEGPERAKRAEFRQGL